MPHVHPKFHLTRLYGGEAIYMPGATFGPRQLQSWEFVWIIAGNVSYIADGVAYDAPPGAVILARPGFRERYVWDPVDTTRHAFFHFDVARLPADWPDIATWPILRTFAAGDPLRPLFRYVVDRLLPRTVDRKPALDACRVIETMIGVWLDRGEPAGGGSDRPARFSVPVERALQWAEATLNAGADRAISLDELADQASVSPKHLCRLFTAELGLSPMRAVHAMRLERAMMLVWRSDLPVQQIASRCGFASPYHFSRSFSRLYGRSPRAVRDALDRGQFPPVADLPWRGEKVR